MGRKSFQNRLATRVSKADKAIDQGFRKVTKRLKSFQNRLATRVSKAGKAINRELEAGHHRNSRTKALREKPSLRQHSPALRGVLENGTNAHKCAQAAARNSPPTETRPRSHSNPGPCRPTRPATQTRARSSVTCTRNELIYEVLARLSERHCPGQASASDATPFTRNEVLARGSERHPSRLMLVNE